MDTWWDADWPYRVPVTVDGDGNASVNLDFTQLFADLGLNDSLLDLRSIRVVPYLSSIPGEPIPHEETYSILFIDAESLNENSNLPPYWEKEGSTELELDGDRYTQGTASIHSQTFIDEGSDSKTGFFYHFSGSENWSTYDTLLYDVWPAVNASAIDQSPDLYSFKLGGGCPSWSRVSK